MKIKLGNFEIEGSELISKYSKFNLYSLHPIKTGKMKGVVRKKGEWFDCSLEQCMKTIAQLETKDGEFKNIDDYLIKLEQVSKNIQEYCNTVEKEFQKLVQSNKQNV